MEKQKIQHLTLSFFYLLILAVPIYWIIRGDVDSKKSLAEGRILKGFPSINVQNGSITTDINQQNPEKSDDLFGQILGKAFQRNVEQAASDQFPFRFSGILVSKAVDRFSIDLAYALLPDIVIPSDMKSGLYVFRDGSQLIAAPNIFNSETRIRLEEKAKDLDQLIKANPDVNFYLFYHQKISDSPYHPLNSYFKTADMGKTWDYFTSIAPDNLTIGTLMLSSLDEDKYFYYRTDHHMNVNGSLYAYNQIYEILARGYPQISPKLNTDYVLEFPNLDFLGSYARRSLYPIQADKFSVPITTQPSFEIYKDNQPYQFNQMEEYQAGDYSNLPYENHYGFYYGNNPAPFIDYRSENGSTRSILVIGSSYSRPVLPLLAAHYQHVYYLDLRRNKEFSFKEFSMKNPVDDVLIFADYSILVNNDIWKINQ